MSTTTSPFADQAARFAKVAWKCHLVSSALWQEAQRRCSAVPRQFTQNARQMSCVLADQHRQALRLVAQLDGAAAWDMENRSSGADHG
jgi:hypothetical protein